MLNFQQKHGDMGTYIYFNISSLDDRTMDGLVSLSMIDAEGNSFYAEFTDYNENIITPVLLREVIKPLISPQLHTEGTEWVMKGTKNDVRVQCASWLYDKIQKHKVIQFVSFNCSNNFYVLMDFLTNHGILKWEAISPCVIDIAVMLADTIILDDNKSSGVLTGINPVYIASQINLQSYWNELVIQGQVEYISNQFLKTYKNTSFINALYIKMIHGILCKEDVKDS